MGLLQVPLKMKELKKYTLGWKKKWYFSLCQRNELDSTRLFKLYKKK